MATYLLSDYHTPLSIAEPATIEQIAATLAGSGLGTVRLDELQWAAIENALVTHHGNRTHAARALGISIRTLQRRLRDSRAYGCDAAVVD
jgi:ActR/RegA family two-component response regulator